MHDRTHVPHDFPDLLHTVPRGERPFAEPLLSAWVSPNYVCLDGDLCAHAAAGMRAPLLAHFQDLRSGHGDVVIDMTWLRFIDSAGVRLLQEFGDCLTQANRRLELHQPPALVQRVLAIADAYLGRRCHAAESEARRADAT
jgi:anti-anti-sigma factor